MYPKRNKLRQIRGLWKKRHLKIYKTFSTMYKYFTKCLHTGYLGSQNYVLISQIHLLPGNHIILFEIINNLY